MPKQEEHGEQPANRQPMSFGEYLRHYLLYLVKWVILAAIIGIVCGFTGALFYNGVMWVTAFREAHTWLLFFMPAAGLLIVFLYRMLGQEGASTDTIIEAAREGHEIRIGLLPSIFTGTLLTHLTGGSAGREGAALQIGGSIGNKTGMLLHLDRSEMKIATMAGMAAFFSAIFGTPLTAAMFVILFLSVGTFYEVALLPCYLASLASLRVSTLFGVQAFRFSVEVPEILTHHFVRVLILAALTGLVSMLFCAVLHGTEGILKKYLKNPYVRAACGGLAVIALTLLEGSGDYNGAGGAVIARALAGEHIAFYAFLLKILFTAITLGAGFKGGEIVPTFFIGATFGAVAGPLLGIPASFGAAVGLVAMFAGVTNTVIASIFLAMEVFGGAGILYFALASIVSYACSGYNGLYSSQRILYSKVRPEYIDLRTNHNHLVKKARFIPRGKRSDQKKDSQKERQ